MNLYVAIYSLVLKTNREGGSYSPHSPPPGSATGWDIFHGMERNGNGTQHMTYNNCLYHRYGSLAVTHLLLTSCVSCCKYQPFTNSHGPHLNSRFCPDHVIHPRYLRIVLHEDKRRSITIIIIIKFYQLGTGRLTHIPVF